MSPLFIGLKYVSLKDVSLKDVVVPLGLPPSEAQICRYPLKCHFGNGDDEEREDKFWRDF